MQKTAAPATFTSRADPERFLAQMDLDRVRGAWVDPDAGAIPLAAYAEQWLMERPEMLRPRTLELYRGQLTRHILPTFGPVTSEPDHECRGAVVACIPARARWR